MNKPCSEQSPIQSFSRYASGRSIIRQAANLENVRACFEEARKNHIRVAIRSGGHSFHDQALHDGDQQNYIVLCADALNSDLIEFAPGGRKDRVRLGAGVKWGGYFLKAVEYARAKGEPVRIPGSMQTGRGATVGGTLSGDCLSRFSGVMGKESQWIESFRVVTPGGDVLDVSAASNPRLFNAVIGGHGYLGLVLEATYKLIEIPLGHLALTKITTYTSFAELVPNQLSLIRSTLADPHPAPRAVSAVWFTDLVPDPLHPDRIKGGVFDSTFGPGADPPRLSFPLYGDIDSGWRVAVEILSRTEPVNWIVHEFLYNLAQHQGEFQNGLFDFLFFMDGNTVAKERFEQSQHAIFPILQQTFVVPPEKAVDFAQHCERTMKSLPYLLRPTESDMLFAARDRALMSANYEMDGFAITFAFEPPDGNPSPPGKVVRLFEQLSEDCRQVGGRIHLVKNVYAKKNTLRRMFSPQIEEFEAIKRDYDPWGILQNRFSGDLFNF
jgi:decaprenylphospho-beta-D-ribofuranose 2-oxidase